MRLVTLAVLPALALPLGAQQPAIVTGPLPPNVTASARNETKITPDRATVLVSVETRGKTAAAAGTENARVQRVTMAALRAQGLTTDQLSTVDYSVYPEQTYDQATNQSRITGYVARNTIRADVRQIAKVGDVIDAALAGGATTISSVQFYASNVDTQRRQALAGAIGKACQDADAMARAAGGRIGNPLELSSEAYNPPPRPMEMAMQARAKTADSPPTEINPGDLTLVVSVTGRWPILYGGGSALDGKCQ